jgi:hypothetical protein
VEQIEEWPGAATLTEQEVTRHADANQIDTSFCRNTEGDCSNRDRNPLLSFQRLAYE